MTTPSVVFLHGVGLDHTMWEPVVEALEGRCTVVTPDLPGHGAKPAVPTGTTLANLAEGVLGEIPPGSHVVGFSLGALVAQHLAVHHAHLVATLICVSAVCQRTADEQRSVLARLRAAQTDFVASAEASLARWYDGADVEDRWVQRTKDMLLANDVDSFLRCYRVFATADAEIGLQLHRITAPALAVTGGADPGSTPAMAHRLAAALPHCTAAIFPGARHMLPVERPQALAHRIDSFIGERPHV